MKYNGLFRRTGHLNFKLLLVLALILSASGLYAQSPSDFSGTWVFDISKSNAGEGSSFGSSDITHIISQDPSTISIEEIIGQTNIGRNIFTLDGKETTEQQGSMKIKKSAAWSQDKKMLTLIEIRTIDAKDYRSDDAYSLSDNGLVLTVQSVIQGPGFKTTTIWVYNKKRN